jgi:hypothetical protein
MKRCPRCNRTYTDDSLKFCLDDGSLLTLSNDSSGSDDLNATLPYGPTQGDTTAPTAIFVPRDSPAHSVPTVPSMPRADDLGRPRAVPDSPNRVLTFGVISIAVLLLVIASIGVVFLYRHWKASDTASPLGSPPGVSSPAPTATRETGSDDSGKPKTAPLQIKVTASSVRYALQNNTYDPANVVDGNKRTAWIEGVDGPGIAEWLNFDFGRDINLHRILILPGYFKSAKIWAQNNRLAAATFQFSDGSSRRFTFPDRMERQSLDVGSIRTRWVRLVINEVYYGTDPDTAVSEVAFEWEP